MPIPVSGGKSKRKYTMTVGDTGRSYKDDETGEDLDDATFKEREGDYTTVAPERVGRERGSRNSSGAQVSGQTSSDLAYKKETPKPSLADAAKRYAQPTPTPTPDPNKKKKQKAALSGY